MAKDDMIRKSFDFLRNKAESGEVVTLDELASATGWKPKNTKTNISKRLKQFGSTVFNGKPFF